jgi:cyclophilin family peptidyl-prolyl cis-trans isomerase
LRLVSLLLCAAVLLGGACSSSTGASGARRTPVATVAARTAVPTAGAGGATGAAPAGSTPSKQWSSPPEMTIDTGKQYTATLKTSMGDVTVELFADEAPRTVNNFVFLAREGFYDNAPFHRIMKDFMIQGGDPTGTGTGGPGYRFDDEPIRRDYDRGIVAMANAGRNTNGSQFFIMHGNRPLPKNYVIFGRVVDGMDVVDRLANVPVRPNPQGEASVPTQDVRITGVTIQER